MVDKAIPCREIGRYFVVGLTVVAPAPEGTLKTPVVYPAAVMKSGKHPEAAKKFLEFLRTPECAKVFEAVGFTVVR